VKVRSGEKLKGSFIDRKHFNPTWGYCGNGPHQLARALLTDFLRLGNIGPDMILTRGFVLLVVSRLDQDKNWVLSGRQVFAAVQEITSFGIDQLNTQYREFVE
jgi:hypothetical protein